MRKIINKINGIYVLVAFILMILFFVLVFPFTNQLFEENANTRLIPDMLIFYSPTNLEELALIYGESGRDYYILTKYTLDIVWPLCYTLSLAVILMYLFKSAKKFYFSLFLPIAVFAFDMLENITLSIVFSKYPTMIPALGYMASVFSTLKWVTVAVIMVFALIMLGKLLKVHDTRRD
jgi:hypothetical protein